MYKIFYFSIYVFRWIPPVWLYIWSSVLFQYPSSLFFLFAPVDSWRGPSAPKGHFPLGDLLMSCNSLPGLFLHHAPCDDHDKNVRSQHHFWCGNWNNEIVSCTKVLLKSGLYNINNQTSWYGRSQLSVVHCSGQSAVIWPFCMVARSTLTPIYHSTCYPMSR